MQIIQRLFKQQEREDDPTWDESFRSKNGSDQVWGTFYELVSKYELFIQIRIREERCKRKKINYLCQQNSQFKDWKKRESKMKLKFKLSSFFTLELWSGEEEASVAYLPTWKQNRISCLSRRTRLSSEHSKFPFKIAKCYKNVDGINSNATSTRICKCGFLWTH